jgi:phosphopantetheine adenylyltransferase
MIIKLTNHAKIRLKDRNLTIKEIEETIKNYDTVKPDKFDPLVIHYIKKMDNKFLRVIAKWKDEETLLVISAFYDRRLKKKGGKDD